MKVLSFASETALKFSPSFQTTLLHSLAPFSVSPYLIQISGPPNPYSYTQFRFYNWSYILSQKH